MATPVPSLTTIQSRNPATGQIFASYEATPATGCAQAVQRAREAQLAWAAISLAERCRLVTRLADAIYARRERLAEVVTNEIGKPRAEALFADVLISLETAKYYARHAPEFLAAQSVSHQNLAVSAKTGRVLYAPFGVIAVIAPWNYPLAIPFGHCIPAVLGGNAVVLKPSERAPACGQLVGDCFLAAGFPRDLLQVVHGGPEVGAALVDAGPDKVVFTGSSQAGQYVAESCARRLIPSSLELGGKDAMIVLAGANLETASSAAVWGAFTNCGQACLSVERIFVERSIAEEFIGKVVAKTAQLRIGPGSDPDVEIGPMILPQSVDRVEEQLRAAVAGGARILAGGRRRPELGPCYFEPTIVTDVDAGMPLMKEPIFGPIVAIQPVAGVEEAVAWTNDCAYGLSAGIWTADGRRGREIAARIRRAGAVMVNDVASYFGILAAPHGGSGLSGWGRTHSRIGLLEMVRVRYTDVDWLPHRPKPWWFGYDEALVQTAESFIRFSHAPQWRNRWLGAVGSIRAFFRGHRM